MEQSRCSGRSCCRYNLAGERSMSEQPTGVLTHLGDPKARHARYRSCR